MNNKLLLLIFILLLSSFSVSAIISDSLVSYWNNPSINQIFNDTLEHNNGTSFGVNVVSGYINTGAFYAGRTNYTIIQDTNVNYPLDNYSQLHLGFWLKVNNDTDGRILHKNLAYSINYISNGNIIRFRLYNSSGNTVEISGSIPLLLNNWYRIDADYDGYNMLTYINGTLDGSGTLGGSVANNSNPLHFGIDEDLSTARLNGTLDEIGLWNTSLSATEILNMFLNYTVNCTPLNLTCGSQAAPTNYYYFNQSGNDANDCSSPSLACQSIAKANSTCVTAGDTCLFQFGSVWRFPNSSYIKMTDYVTYKAYGDSSLEFPTFLGSVYGSNSSYWTTSGGNKWNFTANVSATNNGIHFDVGNIIFDNDASVGYLHKISQLSKQDDFNYSSAGNVLTVYSIGNPALVHSSIEIAVKKDIINIQNRKNVTLDSIQLKYTSAHAIGGSDSSNLTERNLRVGWIGGSYNTNARYGNGIENAGSANYNLIEYNNVTQVYDAGITLQNYNGQGIDNIKNNIIRFNIITFCGYGIEHFAENAGSNFSNNLITQNTIDASGRGWYNQTEPQRHPYASAIKLSGVSAASNNNFTNNILINSTYNEIDFNASGHQWNGDSPYRDNNLFFNGSNANIGNSFYYLLYYQGTGTDSFRDLTSFHVTHPTIDTNSIMTNPLFQAGIYTPNKNSLACSISSTGSYVGALPCASSDTVAPIITVTSPTASVYTNDTILINFTAIDETNLSNLWYYNGTTNVSYTNGTSQVHNYGEGSYTLYFYANDTSNNIGTQSVTFTVDYSPYSENLNNNASSPLTGDAIYFNVTLKDNIGLSGYKYISNVTDTSFSNSSFIPVVGTIVMAEATLTSNTVNNTCLYFWFNDTSGTSNTTNLSCFTTRYRDIVAPTYLGNNNNANNPLLGDTIIFNVTLQDNINLSGYIFATNETGSFINATFTSLVGNYSQVNESFIIPDYGTFCGQFWFNDTSNNINVTNYSCFNLSEPPPPIQDYLYYSDDFEYDTSELANYGWHCLIWNNITGTTTNYSSNQTHSLYNNPYADQLYVNEHGGNPFGCSYPADGITLGQEAYYRLRQNFSNAIPYRNRNKNNTWEIKYSFLTPIYNSYDNRDKVYLINGTPILQIGSTADVGADGFISYYLYSDKIWRNTNIAFNGSWVNITYGYNGTDIYIDVTNTISDYFANYSTAEHLGDLGETWRYSSTNDWLPTTKYAYYDLYTVKYWNVFHADPTINLIFPPNNIVNLTYYQQNFTFNIDFNMSNCTLFTNLSGTFKANETISNIIEFTNYDFQLNLTPVFSDYTWNVRCIENNSAEWWSASNLTFRVNTLFSVNNISTSYTNVTYKGSTEKFYLNFSMDTILYSISSIVLHYDNNSYVSTFTKTGFNYSSITTIVTPEITHSRNATFYWILTRDDNTNLTTDQYNQTILNFGIDNCSNSFGIATNNTALNISFIEYNNNQAVNVSYAATIFYGLSNANINNYSYSYQNTALNKISYCIYPIDFVLKTMPNIIYTDSNSVQYTYFPTETDFNNVTKSWTLYTQNSTLTQVLFTVQDVNGLPLKDYIIQILRYDVGTGTYKNTETLSTDADGHAIGNMILSTAYYNFLIYNPSNKLVLTETGVRLTSTTKSFTISETTDTWYTDLLGYGYLNSNLYYNNATNNVVYTWSDPANSVTAGCLEVSVDNITGQSQIYSYCSSGASGSIVYPVSLMNNSHYTAKGTLKYSGNNLFDKIIDWYNNGSLDFSTTPEKFNMLFICILLLLLGALIGVPNPFISLLYFMGVLALSFTLHLWSISLTSLGGLIMLGLIVMFSGSRQQ